MGEWGLAVAHLSGADSNRAYPHDSQGDNGTRGGSSPNAVHPLFGRGDRIGRNIFPGNCGQESTPEVGIGTDNMQTVDRRGDL